MRHRVRFILNLVLLGLIASSGTGGADITPIDYSPPPAGGGASPKSPHETIRLESQEVTIRLRPSSYTVDAVFRLFNSGETTTEWVGFPKRAMGRSPGPLGRLSEFIRFDVRVNGRETPMVEERDPGSDGRNLPERLREGIVKHSGWLVGKALFPARSITRIRVSYSAHYQSCGFSCRKAGYIYGTGRHWKGSIGKAVFIVDSMDKGGAAERSPRFSGLNLQGTPIRRRLISPNLARYEVSDFEPADGGALTITLSTDSKRKDPKYALLHAAMNGRGEQINELVKAGADVNAISHGSTPLMAAARHGSVPTVKLLLEKGADVNVVTERGNTALKAVLSNAAGVGDQLSVARLLKEHGATPSCLETAAFVGDMEAVKRFLEAGADLKAKGTRESPHPLSAAALGGQCEAVELLLAKGADIETKDRYGDTPLIKAAATGQTDVIKLLLAKGAKVNVRNVHRRTAMEKAAWWGHADAVRALADGGADINARDDPADRTPLMHAAQMGRLEAVKALLEKGALINARDNSGKTALGLVRGFRYSKEMEDLLKAHGAKQ